MLHRLLAPRPALLLSALLVAGAAALPQPGWAFQVTPQWSSGSVQVSGSGPRMDGSGHVSESRRNIGAFTKLRVDGPLTVHVRGAGQAGLRVRADDNLHTLVVTQVEGDTLVVKLSPGANFYTANPMTVDVDAVQLDAAALRGSGDIIIDAVRGNRFEAAVAGSGDIVLNAVDVQLLSVAVAGSGDLKAKGRADQLKASMAGSGDLWLVDLSARSASVTVAGSGDARVFVTEALSASVAGSGDIYYSGDAKVSKSVVGSGDVTAVKK